MGLGHDLWTTRVGTADDQYQRTVEHFTELYPSGWRNGSSCECDLRWRPASSRTWSLYARRGSSVDVQRCFAWSADRYRRLWWTARGVRLCRYGSTSGLD
uniref:(northern house mosquito) hypothetical protein n=1 Tax=Culex pipiens TaxID=7175 RepID=A0A8D8F0B3_CULPI